MVPNPRFGAVPARAAGVLKIRVDLGLTKDGAALRVTDEKGKAIWSAP